jgi:hypothetical protein
MPPVRLHRWIRAAMCAVAAVPALQGPARAQEPVDAATIGRIMHEASARSQVMDLMSWLTDVHGPRLTGSPLTKAAGDWAIGRMKEWGLANVGYETWGPFGRGWVLERFEAQVIAPVPFPLIAFANAWSYGTNGPVTGEVVRLRLDSMPDLDANRGKVRGKWVVLQAPPPVEPHFTPQALRLDDAQLETMARATPPEPGGGRGGRAGGPGGRGGFSGAQTFAQARAQWLVTEGALGVLAGGRGDGGTMFLGGAASRDPAAPRTVPSITVSSEHYGRIWRMLDRNQAVQIQANIRVRFADGDGTSFNIVGEIPGSDPRLRNEVVMIGAHFDSWHSATGATDNAAGTAVMMEAMRLLRTLNLQPRRTVRIGLWTGEEQGLLGSRAYVRAHYGTADSAGLRATPEHALLSGYFNVDNGTGKIRGVYLQGNAAVAPVFDAWMGPFKAGGMKTLTIANTGGTDHLAFDAVGLPGFQFIQDPVEYNTRTHHSNQDVYERVEEDDMKWNAAVVAAFAWQAAQRNDKLPRKAPPGRVVP